MSKVIAIELKLTQEVDTTGLPQHKILNVGRKRYLIVPRKLDYALELRRLGLTNTRITKNFKFGGPYTPYDHQRVTVEMLAAHKGIYCLNGMGTGKTACCVWAVEFLRAAGKVRKTLIITTKSCMRSVWCREIYNLYPYSSVEIAHGSVDERITAIQMEPDYLIINPDGIPLVLDELIRHKYDVIVIDECTSYKHVSSQRHKALTELLEYTRPEYIWPLTGTPTSTAPTDVHGVIRLVHPEKMRMSFTEFRDMVMYKQSPFKWAPRDNALDTIKEIMQPAVRFAKSDCLDMPPVTYIHRQCALSSDQTKAFAEMKTNMRTQRTSGEIITAVNAAVKLTKLLQICMGAVYDKEKNIHYLDSKPRLEELLSIIDEANDKTLILVPFTSVAPILEKYLAHKKRSPKIINGGTTSKEREKILTEFQHGNRVTDIVAHPGTVSHGLNLTSSHTTIWYGPPISMPEHYGQTNNRMNRPGQKHYVNIIHMSGCDFEDKLYKAVAARENFQSSLLSIYDDLTKEL